MTWEATKPLRVIRYGQTVRLRPGDAVHPDDEIALKYELHRGAIRRKAKPSVSQSPPKTQPKPKVQSKPVVSKPIPKKTPLKVTEKPPEANSKPKEAKETTEKVQEKKEEEPKTDDLDIHHTDSDGP